MIPLDAVCNLFASPCLLCCSSGLWSLRREVVHNLVFGRIRYGSAVLGFPMAFEFFSCSLIKVQRINEAKLDAFRDVSPSRLGFGVAGVAVQGLFIVGDDSVHIGVDFQQ